MTSSIDGAMELHRPAPSNAGGPPEVPVPPAIASMWRLFKLGYSHEPRLLAFAVIVTILSAVPDALLALWLKLLADGVTSHQSGQVAWAAVGMALSVALTWVMLTVSGRMTRRFRDKVTIALETHVARLQATIGTVAHHERADYLDRLAVLRNQIFVLDHMYMAVLSTLSWIVRLVITIGLLVSVHPLLILLALFAVPTVVSSSIRPTKEREVEERQAVHQRLAEHLFQTGDDGGGRKEVRISGIGDSLVRDRRTEWERWYGPVSKARNVSAAWHAVSWAVFGIGFVAAVWFVAVPQHGTPGQVLMILAAGSRLSAYVASTVGEIGFIRGVWLYGSRRLAWLEDYAAAVSAEGDTDAPSRLQEPSNCRRLVHLPRQHQARAGRRERADPRRDRRRRRG